MSNRERSAPFLSGCTPLARAFFLRMCDEAERHGMVVRPNPKSFSVRMPLTQLVTLMYAFAPDRFQVYTTYWPVDDEERAIIHGRLHEVAPFHLHGCYTNELRVDDQTQQQAEAALEVVWSIAEELMARAGASTER
jgi:hypothetical protein